MNDLTRYAVSAQDFDKELAELKPIDKNFLGYGMGAQEGDNRGPFSGYGEFGNDFVLTDIEDGWQRALNVGSTNLVPAAFACGMQNAKGVSQCTPQHIRIDNEGRKTVIDTSPAARVLRNPNDYETWSQFMLNTVAQVMFQGESFAYCIRDDRGAIQSMHRLNQNTCTPYVDPDTNAIFYAIGSNPMLPDGVLEVMIPQRDVWHLRQYCPRHPLIGETALKQASIASGINTSLSAGQLAFFTRMSRPSGLISSDLQVNKTQMDTLRAAWKEQSAYMQKGGIPILGGGMKFQSLSLNSQDAQLIEAQKMSIEDIARVFGVPLPVIGTLENSTLNNVAELIRLWLSTGLGSLISTAEQSLSNLFGLSAKDSINLDESVLLRMDFESRMSGLKTAVQGGVYTVNEARGKEGLHKIDGGDEVFLQQQMVPLGWHKQQAAAQAQATTNQLETAVQAESDAIVAITDESNKRLEEIHARHELERDLFVKDSEFSQNKTIEELEAKHAEELAAEALKREEIELTAKAEHEETMTRLNEELAELKKDAEAKLLTVDQQVSDVLEQHEKALAEIADLEALHAESLSEEALKLEALEVAGIESADKAEEYAAKIEELEASLTQEAARLEEQNAKIAELNAQHKDALVEATLKQEELEIASALTIKEFSEELRGEFTLVKEAMEEKLTTQLLEVADEHEQALAKQAEIELALREEIEQLKIPPAFTETDVVTDIRKAMKNG